MHSPKFIVFLDLVVTAFVIFDLVRAHRLGRARVWLGGTATREHQPLCYWRSVRASYGVLAFLAIIFLWATIWPDSLR